MKTPSDNENGRLYEQVIQARHGQGVGFQRLLSPVIVVLVVVTISLKFIWTNNFPTAIVQLNLLLALSAFFYLLLTKIAMFVRVSEFKRAVHDLRIADWREFEFLYIRNRLRAEFMLRNAAFILLAGWYLYRQQRTGEGSVLIAFALEKNPELRTIDLSRHTGLSYDDEKILINDVEKEIHANFIHILWSSPRAKATVIIVGVIVVALHYIFKIVEIYKGFR